MKKEIKYSIIIPAYNAENTISKCLRSILCQRRNDIEIIVINDGSSDNTEKVIQDLIYTDSNGQYIRYVNKENEGVSSARNMGIQMASGIFITFVDSDDYVTGNYFKVLDQSAETDLLVFDAEINRGRSNISFDYTITEDTSYFKNLYMLQKSGKMNSPWNKRFKRSIITENHIHFAENIQIAEDHLFCLTYALKCNTIAFIPDVIYCFQTGNPDSLSNAFRKDMYKSMISVSLASEREIQESSLTDSQKREIYKLIDYLFVIRAINSIAEDFKVSRFNYIKDRKSIASICNSFSHHIGGNKDYRNILHFTIRFLLDHHMNFLTYTSAYVLKYNKTKRYRAAHQSRK